MSFELAGRSIGPDDPLFVVAELGLNHQGSLERALLLVDLAADAGASAVKLQTFAADDLVAPAAPAPLHVHEPSLRSFFRRFELDEDAHRCIAARARARGLALVATPFSLAAVDMLERIGVDAFKIASGDITFHALVDRCARTGKPLFLSTGMAALGEVAAAVRTAAAAGNARLVLLHCVSAYPVPAGSENLLAIATLRRVFNAVAGLSDHAPDTSSVPVAVTLGAAVYERHLMLPDDEGVDRAVSSTPGELAAVVRIAARTKAALGHGRIECLAAEAPNVKASRRSLHAARDLRPGDVIGAEDVIALRPAEGLPPSALGDLVGSILTRAVARGEAFRPGDVAPAAWRCDVA